LAKFKKTLIGLVIQNFFERKGGGAKFSNKNKFTASISSILVELALRKVKGKERAEASIDDVSDIENDELKKEKGNEPFFSGGYGTVSKHYGMSRNVNYADYSKIWNHLGSFTAYNLDHDIEKPNEIVMKNGESSRQMVSMEVVEKSARHFKYFILGDVVGGIGFVPPVGANIDSKDWEKYRLMSMMSVYQPLLKLKWNTA
jgi:hypothetical protein